MSKGTNQVLKKLEKQLFKHAEATFAKVCSELGCQENNLLDRGEPYFEKCVESEAPVFDVTIPIDVLFVRGINEYFLGDTFVSNSNKQIVFARVHKGTNIPSWLEILKFKGGYSYSELRELGILPPDKNLIMASRASFDKNEKLESSLFSYGALSMDCQESKHGNCWFLHQRPRVPEMGGPQELTSHDNKQVAKYMYNGRSIHLNDVSFAEAGFSLHYVNGPDPYFDSFSRIGIVNDKLTVSGNRTSYAMKKILNLRYCEDVERITSNCLKHIAEKPRVKLKITSAPEIKL